MAGSSSYWNLAERTGEKFEGFAAVAKGLYGNVESNDDPGALADELSAFIENVRSFINTIELGIDPMRDAAKALDQIPKLP